MHISDVPVAVVVEATSFPGSLFSAYLSRWNRDPGCGWSHDHLSIQNRRVGGYSSTLGREDGKIPPCCPTLPEDFSTNQILGGHARDQPQPGSLFQRLREAEKKDPGTRLSLRLPKLPIVRNRKRSTNINWKSNEQVKHLFWKTSVLRRLKVNSLQPPLSPLLLAPTSLALV